MLYHFLLIQQSEFHFFSSERQNGPHACHIFHRVVQKRFIVKCIVLIRVKSKWLGLTTLRIKSVAGDVSI